LRDGGWDAVHAGEIGMHSSADLEILDYAAREGRVVITLDRDFPQILALIAMDRPSVVLIHRQGLRTTDLVVLLASVWQEYEEALDSGCVLRVSARGTRARLLPLK
jgi:predicted nuclease of predicted toxin-antitoxin system